MTSTTIDAGVQRIRDQVMEAANRGAGLRIRGAGTWLDAERPVAAGDTLSVAEHSGIVEYVSGDLTMTVRAGTTLAEIRDAAAAHNQWLALDPHGSDAGTIGASVVTASAGPLATFFGTPRDLVLGVEFVSGTGAIARGGGRVVKNVAGFDLTRLMIGSWGTLGVLTEVTVRLHAKPAVDRTAWIDVGPDGAERARALLRQLPFKPYACEILNARLAEQLIGQAATVALVRLAGNEASVEAQRAAVSALGKPGEIAGDVWARLRAVEPPGATVVRLSNLPTEIGSSWRAANSLPGALVHASPARGIVRVIAGDAGNSLDLIALSATSGATVVPERLSAEAWAKLPVHHDALNDRVKQSFDPANVLNPRMQGLSS